MPDSAPESILQDIRTDIQTLPESGIVEIANYAREKADVTRMWVGEGDLPTPDFICEAANEGLARGETFYTYQRGIPPLRDALARYHERVYGVPVARERINVIASGMQAIMETMQMLIGPGDEIVIPAPVWPNIFSAAHIQGGVPRFVPLRLGNDGWKLDLDQLFDACGPRTRAIFMNSPGNPTGWMISREDMIRVRDFARERGIWIVADDVYGRITYDVERAPSFLELMEPEERLVVVNTFSKNWAMTGWRMGWVVAPPELGQVYENLVQYNTSGVPPFLQRGAVAALDHGEEFFQSMLARCREGREIVCNALAEAPRVRFARPGGAFYLFFAVDGEPDSRALAFRLVDEARVGLAPGTAFSEEGEGYMRLCFAASADRVAAAMERLVPALR